MTDKYDDETQGFYKLNWIQRIGYGAGDMGQNFIYNAAGALIPFYYTDVYQIGGKDNAKEYSGTLLLVVRLIDVIWDPIVGAFVDKHNPRWGKYRSYLILAGFPLCVLFFLCFWDIVKGSVIYAAITYTLLQMCYTLTNVPYGALNASLTRDTDEITTLTTTRMAMANIGGLCVWTGAPIVVGLFAGDPLPWKLIIFNFIGAIPGIFFMPFVPIIKKLIGKKNIFYVFGCIAIIGYAMLYMFSRGDKAIDDHNWTMVLSNFVKSTGVGITTGYMWAIVPEVISYAEYTTGRRIAGIVNALTGLFFKAGFAIGGALPNWVLALTDYEPGVGGGNTMSTKSSAWMKTVLCYGIIGFLLLVYCFTQTKERVVMDDKETSNVKVTDLFTEFFRNGPLRVIALYFITAFCAMNTGNSSVNWLYGMDKQSKGAQEGIRWAACVIPAIFNVIMMIIIFFYSLTDEKIDEINKEIERRNKKTDDAELA